jgi:TonB family protein
MRHPVLLVALGCVVIPLGLSAQTHNDVKAQAPLTTDHSRPTLLADVEQQETSDPQDVQVDEFPQPLKKVDPKYPELAQKAGIEGKVYIQLSIDTTGTVTDAKVIKTDHEILNEPALQAARQWTFTPAMKDKKKIAIVLTVPFAFKLADKMKSDGAKEKEAYALPQTVRKLLAGGDDADARGCILPDAYLIDGNVQVNLLEAVSGRTKTAIFSAERSRSVGMVRMTMNDEMTAAFVVAVTDGEKPYGPHWHSVVWTKTKEGKWKIQHWHTSR